MLWVYLFSAWPLSTRMTNIITRACRVECYGMCTAIRRLHFVVGTGNQISVLITLWLLQRKWRKQCRNNKKTQNNTIDRDGINRKTRTYVKTWGDGNCEEIAFRYIAYFGQITLHSIGRAHTYFMYFSCIIHTHTDSLAAVSRAKTFRPT